MFSFEKYVFYTCIKICIRNNIPINFKTYRIVTIVTSQKGCECSKILLAILAESR